MPAAQNPRCSLIMEPWCWIVGCAGVSQDEPTDPMYPTLGWLAPKTRNGPSNTHGGVLQNVHQSVDDARPFPFKPNHRRRCVAPTPKLHQFRTCHMSHPGGATKRKLPGVLNLHQSGNEVLGGASFDHEGSSPASALAFSGQVDAEYCNHRAAAFSSRAARESLRYGVFVEALLRLHEESVGIDQSLKDSGW